MKCFICGTAGFGRSAVTSLPDPVKDYILKLVTEDIDIIIGDCQGIDALVQEELKALNYQKVTVYCSGNRVRNNIGNWKVKNVFVPRGITGRDFYAVKDEEMCWACDFGFAIWDGKSKGTDRNITSMIRRNKQVNIYRTDKKTWDIQSNS